MLFDLNIVKREFFAGGTAGSIGILIGFPFDNVKVQLQIYPEKFRSPLACFLNILKTNGISGGLYRGCVPPVLMQGLINSFMFTGESITLRFLEPNLRNSELGGQLNHFVAGSVGGLVSCIVLVPSEVVKCTMQIQATTSSSTTAHSIYSKNQQHIKYHNIFSETIMNMKMIYKAEGIMGFYKGFGATALRDAPSIGLYFSTYKNTRDFISRYDGSGKETPPSAFATLFAGGLAGAVSWTLVYPIDVIKTHAQVSGITTNNSTNNSSTISNINSSSSITKNSINISSTSSSTTEQLNMQDSTVGKNMKVTQQSYKYMNSWQIGKILYRRYGIKVFYSGLSITILRAFPVNASTFFFYEYFKTLLRVQEK